MRKFKTQSQASLTRMVSGHLSDLHGLVKDITVYAEHPMTKRSRFKGDCTPRGVQPASHPWRRAVYYVAAKRGTYKVDAERINKRIDISENLREERNQ
jgi:hypothetical protein